mgnify:CR=1 FL=1
MKTDRADIKIREVGPSEVSILTHYRIAYLTEMQGERPSEYISELEFTLNKYFKEALSEERLFAYIATVDETPVSFGAMVIKKIPGDFNKPLYLEGDILNMYTIPEARRRGISSVVLEHLIAGARERGISKISLHTSKDGEKLYRKYGFTEAVYPILELPL